MPVVLFRPIIDSDRTDWISVLRDRFHDMDFRVWGEDSATDDVEYLISWKLLEGDRTRWPRLKAVLALGAGINQFTGHPEMPLGAHLVRMIEPGLDQNMAEHIVSYVLRFHRDHDRLDQAQKARQWGDQAPPMATQRRIGFMGLGKMARPCIAVLRTMGFSLRGWSRTPHQVEGMSCFSGAAGLAEFLSQTDILVCLLPLTSETEDILRRETLSHLPRGSFLINAGRGKLAVEEDIIALLDDGHIERVALDVFRREPLPEDHPFWSHPRIHVTPHIAAMTMPQTASLALRASVESLEKGCLPEGCVDNARGY